MKVLTEKFAYIIVTKDRSQVYCTNGRFEPIDLKSKSKMRFYQGYGLAYNSITQGIFYLSREDRTISALETTLDIIKVKLSIEEVEDDSDFKKRKIAEQLKEQEKKLEAAAIREENVRKFKALGVIDDNGNINEEYRAFIYSLH